MPVPPTFEPYLVSPFDYLLPGMHMTAFLTFILEKPGQATSVLEAGVTQLISHLPFLTGNVAVSATRLPGREKVYEVQPSTTAILDHYPMVIIKHHPGQYILTSAQGSGARGEGQTVCYDNLFTEEYLPLPLDMGSAEASPVFRFQANILEDGIILCGSGHHMAVDGLGISLVMEALATCCRTRHTKLQPESLPTSPAQEELGRKLILQAAASTAQHVRTTVAEVGAGGQAWATPVPQGVQAPISRKLVLSADRVSQLKDMCSAHLQTPPSVTMSRNDLVSALLWLCVMRARVRLLEPASAGQARSRLSTAVNIRTILRPALPRTYIGNAIHTIPLESPFPMHATVGADRELPGGGGGVEGADPPAIHDSLLSLLTELALVIRRGHASVDHECLQAHLAQVLASTDWTMSAGSRPADFGQSSLRGLQTYQLDFGPVLGMLQDFDVPDPRFKSCAWVLPARFKDAPWEIRLVLEPEAMALVKKDPLILWAKPNKGPNGDE